MGAPSRADADPADAAPATRQRWGVLPRTFELLEGHVAEYGQERGPPLEGESLAHGETKYYVEGIGNVVDEAAELIGYTE